MIDNFVLSKDIIRRFTVLILVKSPTAYLYSGVRYTDMREKVNTVIFQVLLFGSVTKIVSSVPVQVCELKQN